MKRFYKMVTVAPAGDEYHIHLDGKPVKVPGGGTICVPGKKLADLIAQEWAAQTGIIDPETMPLTQILTTAQGSEPARPDMETAVLAYLDTDLLCYRAERPEILAARQAALWDPWLRWFEEQSGARLLTTTGLAALIQPAAAHAEAERRVKSASLWDFTAIQMTTALSGSLILALAFAGHAASAEDVFKASLVEELYRSELYKEDIHGRDPHQEKTQSALRRDLEALSIFRAALRA